VVASGAHLPFSNESFQGIFTLTTHEHIPELEEALNEIIRILKPGGICLFSPAWHTRS
jgi:ubiquinone/menaquinone biosynthesis C-methylase UbiE